MINALPTTNEIRAMLDTAIETEDRDERDGLLALAARDADDAGALATTEEEGEELRRLARLARVALKGPLFLECITSDDEAARYGCSLSEVEDLLDRLPR